MFKNPVKENFESEKYGYSTYIHMFLSMFVMYM